MSHSLRSKCNGSNLYAGLGESLRAQGVSEDVVDTLRMCLTLDPLQENTARSLAFAFEACGRPDEAAWAWMSLGMALEAGRRFSDAAIAYSLSLGMRHRLLDALVRLAAVNLTNGRYAQVLLGSQAAVAISPDHVVAHVVRATVLHFTERSDRAWDELGWVCQPGRIRWRSCEQPLWDGSSLTGKTILLWAGSDYGLGDTIHLVRYAFPLKERGARVVVECQRELVPLVERMACVDQVVGRHASHPAFDVHAPLLLIPLVDRTLRWPIPGAVPFLSVGKRLQARWRRRLGLGGFKKVGLSWGGLSTRRTAAFRFLPLTVFAPLARVRGVELVSLQLGPQAHEATSASTGLRLQPVLNEGCSTTDTAALILSLDLVITVDTMVAHLAGALGKPVWTLLPTAGIDWRWFSGDDSPWYPSMRLFRQRRSGDWAEVLERVTTALSVWARQCDEESVWARQCDEESGCRGARTAQ